MKIYGLQQLTLLDYPGHTACTVFLSGCNYACPYCHNSELAREAVNCGAIDERWFFDFLDRRKNVLEGVAITGGEPTIYSSLYDFIKEIKSHGYLVKLDTNGSNPSLLEDLIEDRLVDYVAMDIKSDPGRYAFACGKRYVAMDKVGSSIKLLIQGGEAGKIDYEFRTTVVDELLGPEDFKAIGKLIHGAKRYYIQPFVDSPSVPCRGFHTPSMKKLSKCLQAVGTMDVEIVEIRGSVMK